MTAFLMVKREREREREREMSRHTLSYVNLSASGGWELEGFLTKLDKMNKSQEILNLLR